MRNLSKFWIFFFVLTLLLLCFGGARRFVHARMVNSVFPYENCFEYIKRGFLRHTTPFFKAQAIVAKNERLEAEVERLRLDALLLAEIAKENSELRESLNLPIRTFREPEKCEIISYGGALGWWQSLKLNKGKNVGIEVGDGVVSSEGLIGRIKAVYDKSSVVELITDPNCRIACSLDLPAGVPSVRGILQGSGWKEPRKGELGFLYIQNPLKLDYLKREFADRKTLPPRTRVVTSGLSDSIPGGITVGWLLETEESSDGLYSSGNVVPAVDFARLKTVFVLVGGGYR